MAGLAVSQAADRFSDWRWRLDNLYWIVDKEGKEVPFKMNWAQERLFDDMHYLNIILKARQLGFTTFIQIFMLDACLFNSSVRAGTIAHTLDAAEEIFADKVKFPYDRLPDGIKAANPAVQDAAKKLSFHNGSSLRVGMSLRAGTYQYLHVSEFGKLCARYPDKAREVATGALNTVQAGQIIFIESTAEGREGRFYDMTEIARANNGKALTELDFKFHFFGWHEEPGYRIDPRGVVIGDELARYFDGLEQEQGIVLDDAQRAWYAKKWITQQDDMKREYPATPEEAFEASLEGAYFKAQMARARREGRICPVPIDPILPVNTFWDLGVHDAMAIWFHQRHGLENRFVGYYENSGEGFAHYARFLDERARRCDFVYGEHFAPHDIEVTEMGSGRTRREIARELGINFVTVPRPKQKSDGIEASRQVLASCWFDERTCDKGIVALESYRKEWDDAHGVWKDKPRHDSASHGADAFQTFAMGYEPDDEDDEDEWPHAADGRSEITGY